MTGPATHGAAPHEGGCRCRFVRTTDLAQRLQAARRELALWSPSASSITLRSRGSSATTARWRSATAPGTGRTLACGMWIDSVARHAKIPGHLQTRQCRWYQARPTGLPNSASQPPQRRASGSVRDRHAPRRPAVPRTNRGGGMGADPDHSLDEDRFILLGVTGRDRLVVVAHTLRSDTIRRINAAAAAAAADCCLMLPDALTCQFMRETGDPIPEPTTVVADSVTVG